MLEQITAVIAKHQLEGAVVLIILWYLLKKSLSVPRRVFGDEDYRTSQWLISLVIPIILAISCIIFTFMLFRTFTI